MRFELTTSGWLRDFLNVKKRHIRPALWARLSYGSNSTDGFLGALKVFRIVFLDVLTLQSLSLGNSFGIEF